ncbi:MAG: glycoside hydrolase family 130 protein, partial [Haloferula sp.]
SFFRKLHDMEFDNAWSRTLMQSLGDYFTRSELDAACVATHASVHEARGTIECIQWLARANYQVNFDPDIPLSQRIIFPTSPNESNGIEDARFVHFRDDDGSENYYATYTAYNGHSILPQLLETPDFLSFQARTFDGACVRNKGMALFPRRINGLYTMLSRQDDENLYLMFSDDVHFWDRAQIIRCPMEGWESVKIGNCGSPIETGAGWLVLTHGVGPMRRYCIGAILLDLDDPSRIIGHLPKPLIEPSEAQRDGYVPNVVYTCGALVHAGKLILPYGLSDTSTTISTIGLDELLARMLPEPALAGTG